MRLFTAALAVCPLFACSSPSETVESHAAPQPESPESKLLLGPASALTAMNLVLAVLDATEAHGTEIVVRDYAADTAPSRAESPEAVLVKLALTFFHEDSLVATRAYNDAANNLEGEDWCLEVTRQASAVLDGGEGIYLDLKVRVLGSPQPASGNQATDSTDFLIRKTAIHEVVQVGQIDMNISETRPAPGVKDTRFHVRRSDKHRGVPLQSSFNFCRALDQEKGLVVTGIEIEPLQKLRPIDRPTGDWTFEVTTTVRTVPD